MSDMLCAKCSKVVRCQNCNGKVCGACRLAKCYCYTSDCRCGSTRGYGRCTQEDLEDAAARPHLECMDCWPKEAEAL
jgi:hypothetical protein